MSRSKDSEQSHLTALEAANAELRHRRAELERTASVLDLVVRQVSAIWWLMDRDLRILMTGGPTLEILGYAPDTYVGTSLLDVPGVDLASVAAHRRALEGETVRHANEYTGKLLESTVAPYRIEGEIIGVIGTTVDVTAIRAMERRMVDAQRAESLGVLAGGLAHDFNNLLVAILGNADLALRDIPPGAPGRMSIENIRNAGLRAAELTDQLLAFAGRGAVAVTQLAPRPMIEELLRIAAPRIGPDLGVTLDIPEELAIRGEAAQARQVFLNLVTNALDAIGDRGSLEIRAFPLRHDGSPHPDDVVIAAADHYVVIEIADSGPGMDRETRRRIFEPFFTTKPTGHGLGLAAVLGIVRAHGGGLRLITGEGQGTRFQVLWPAATQAEAPRGAAVVARTVLVIDDEDLVRDVVARMLEDLGYTALTAPDGMTGLELLEHTAVDAVLVDLTMPRMSGADVVAALRERRPTLPVVLCTGFDRDRRGPVVADAYLPKPFRIEALAETLRSLFRVD